MELIIKDDNGKVITDTKIDALVGVAYVSIKNGTDQGIQTFFNGASILQASYASQVLSKIMDNKVKNYVNSFIPLSEL
jgi:hypothetical protein